MRTLDLTVSQKPLAQVQAMVPLHHHTPRVSSNLESTVYTYLFEALVCQDSFLHALITTYIVSITATYFQHTLHPHTISNLFMCLQTVNPTDSFQWLDGMGWIPRSTVFFLPTFSHLAGCEFSVPATHPTVLLTPHRACNLLLPIWLMHMSSVLLIMFNFIWLIFH